MYEELLSYGRQISNPYLRGVIEYYFEKDEKFILTFKGHSAAKSVHHGFAGGLLEHTLSVVKFCEYMVGQYDILNKDLLYTAAMCHDIGKTIELSPFPENDYTDDGQLLGHIIIGIEMIDDAIREIPEFPKQLASELKHCIVAHHGELEYGSPKKPALAEAMALNLADNADAKMQTLKEIFSCSKPAKEHRKLRRRNPFEQVQKADNATQAQMIMYSKMFKINFSKMDPYEFKTLTDILQRYSDAFKMPKGNGRGKKK